MTGHLRMLWCKHAIAINTRPGGYTDWPGLKEHMKQTMYTPATIFAHWTVGSSSLTVRLVGFMIRAPILCKI